MRYSVFELMNDAPSSMTPDAIKLAPKAAVAAARKYLTINPPDIDYEGSVGSIEMSKYHKGSNRALYLLSAFREPYCLTWGEWASFNLIPKFNFSDTFKLFVIYALLQEKNGVRLKRQLEDELKPIVGTRGSVADVLGPYLKDQFEIDEETLANCATTMIKLIHAQRKHAYGHDKDTISFSDDAETRIMAIMRGETPSRCAIM